jgi:hypothetical protein
MGHAEMSAGFHWCCCTCDIFAEEEAAIKALGNPNYGWNPEPSRSTPMTGTFNFVETENCGGTAPDDVLQWGETSCTVYFDVAKKVTYSISGNFRDWWNEHALIKRDGVVKVSVDHLGPDYNNPCTDYVADSDSDEEASVAAGWHTFLFWAAIEDNPVSYEAVHTDHSISFSVTWVDA